MGSRANLGHLIKTLVNEGGNESTPSSLSGGFCKAFTWAKAVKVGLIHSHKISVV